MKNSFNLTRQFGLFSSITIFFIVLISGYTLSNFLTQKLLWREATVTQDFVDSIIQADEIWSYFHKHKSDQQDPKFELFFQRLSSMPDVVYAKVHDTTNNVIWDNKPERLGPHVLEDGDLYLALNGELVSRYGIAGEYGEGDYQYPSGIEKGTHFFETYIPVWDSQSQVVGVVELYKNPRMLHDAILEGQRLVWGIALLGAVLLFISLFWIIIRASRIMARQQAKLVESESLSMIGETASAVAHAMRNALASIRASAELTLEDDLAGARESAQDIINESDRLNGWASDLLQFSGDGGEVLQVIDIDKLLNDVIEEHQGVMTKANIVLHTALGNTNLLVKANYAPLSQVFGNLIMNAIQAMGNGGALFISVYHQNDDLDTICIDFSDTGPGLSAQIKDKLFKPFATTKPTGTGLGLALSRRILKRYEGTVTVDSKQGGGAIASITLPIIGVLK